MKKSWSSLIGSLSEPLRSEISRHLALEPRDVESPPKWFHKGQRQAWRTKRRFVAIVAGTQSGKTVVGARLLLREIQRTAKGSAGNDYLIVGPDTELLKKKAIPVFQQLTAGLAEYRTSEKCFVFTPQGMAKLTRNADQARVFVGYGHEPDSLEAATYRAVWADECGQESFLRESWEALQRRTAVTQGRIFLTSTPYAGTGWLRALCEDARAGRRKDTEVVTFRSTMNPEFSQEEFERQRRELPEWKFRMFYEGEFTRPAGAVFDCFDPKVHVVRGFPIPAHWPRHLGVDFGESNTAAVCVACDPDTNGLYVYATYHAGGRTVDEHVRAILNKLGGELGTAYGGSWGEDEWRRDFIAAGLPLARPPVREVEVGLQRLYKQFKEGTLRIFDTCAKLAGEVESYSRELDDRGEPLDRIRDRAKYHRLDALRYVVAALRPSASPEVVRYSRLSSPDGLV